MTDNERILRRRIRRDAVLLVHEALRLVVAADHDSPETIMEMTSTCKDLAKHANDVGLALSFGSEDEDEDEDEDDDEVDEDDDEELEDDE